MMNKLNKLLTRLTKNKKINLLILVMKEEIDYRTYRCSMSNKELLQITLWA